MPYPSEKELTTLTRVKSWCRIDTTEHDAVLEELIIRASSTIMLSVNRRNLLSSDITGAYDGNGKQIFYPPFRPINSIDTLHINGIEIPLSTTFNTSGYRFDNDCVRLIGYTFERGSSNIELSYNAGLTNDSIEFNALEQGVLEMINQKWSRKEHPDQSAEWAGDFVKSVFSKNDIPAETRMVINLIRDRIPVY
jgi:hypothetical protein